GIEHLDDTLLVSALVAFQYEARRGHPETRAPIKDVHPFAKIVSIAEAYDALIGGPEGARPDKAMATRIQREARDPAAALPGPLGRWRRRIDRGLLRRVVRRGSMEQDRAHPVLLEHLDAHQVRAVQLHDLERLLQVLRLLDARPGEDHPEARMAPGVPCQAL